MRPTLGITGAHKTMNSIQVHDEKGADCASGSSPCYGAPLLYRTIVADPPWPYEGNLRVSPKDRPRTWNGATGGVSSVDRYGKMEIDELCALKIPSEKDAHLYLWTTNAFIVEAHQTAKAWGFTPKTIVTWGKVRPDGTPSMRAGYYFRGATEHILFAVKGSLRLQGEPTPTLFLSPRLRHSQKPSWFYELVAAQSPAPYLELFARPITPLFQKQEGWYTWGNEMPNDIELSESEAT